VIERLGGVRTKHFEYGQKEMDFLKSADEALGAVIERFGKLERVIIPDLFAALVHAIVGQLISTKAANAIWGRVQERLGEITPRNIATYSTEEIKSCGLSTKKAEYIRKIAQLIDRGELRLDELHHLSDDEVIRRLTALDGVGRWTAEMLLILSMERPDVVSWGDAAIRRGMMRLYRLPSITIGEFEEFRRRYSPYGSVASLYLWAIASE
jgi:DNA-3-methyladenine glycosylase II